MANLPLRQLAIPAAILVAFILFPLGALVLLTPPGAVIRTLGDPEVLGALGLSAAAGLVATAGGLVLGVPLAYVLARAEFPGKRWLDGAIELPVVLPHSAAGIALLFVFGRSGIAGGPIGEIGVALTGNFAGIALAMAFVSVPFLVRAARDAFRAVDPSLERVARTLGATPWRAFARVSLPLAAPGILTGLVLMWARGVSEFGAVVIVAYYPRTAPVLLWDRFERYGLAAAQPLGAALVLIALVLFALAHVAAARLRPRGAAEARP